MLSSVHDDFSTEFFDNTLKLIRVIYLDEGIVFGFVWDAFFVHLKFCVVVPIEIELTREGQI